MIHRSGGRALAAVKDRRLGERKTPGPENFGGALQVPNGEQDLMPGGPQVLGDSREPHQMTVVGAQLPREQDPAHVISMA